MKKIILSIVSIFLCITVFSQKYFPLYPTVYGERVNRIMPMIVLHVPEKDSTTIDTNDSTTQVFYNMKDSSIWAFSRTRGYWKLGSDGVVFDTTNIYYNLSLKLNSSDTTGKTWDWGQITGKPSLITGTGTSGLMVRWITSSTIGNSTILYDNGTNAGATSTFIAPSFKSPSSPHSFSLNILGDNGVGPAFNDGSYINMNTIANYHYVQSLYTPSMGFYVGSYKDAVRNSFMVFKPTLNKVVFNSVVDTLYKYNFKGTSFWADADSILTPNLPATDTTIYVMGITSSGRQVKTLKSSVGGSSTFTALTDGPGAYTGHAGDFTRVNTGQTGLEYVTGQLISALDRSKWDSLASGLIQDSVATHIIPGPTIYYDSVYTLYYRYPGYTNVDSGFSHLMPRLGLIPSNNLSDVTNIATSRSNLGIGTGDTPVFTGVNLSGATASTIASFDGSKNIVSLSTSTYPSLTELSYVKGVTSALQTQLNAKAALASPALTGTPTAPTASAGTNTTQIATTAFVQTGLNTIKSTTSTASSSTPAPVGSSLFNYYFLTALAANATFSAPSGTLANGNSLLIRIKDNGTARTLSWNAIYRGGTSIALPTTTTISKTMYVQFNYNSTDSKWDLVGLTDGL